MVTSIVRVYSYLTLTPRDKLIGQVHITLTPAAESLKALEIFFIPFKIFFTF